MFSEEWQQELKQIAARLEVETGKVCIYKGTQGADPMDIYREAKADVRENRLGDSAIELHFINGEFGDYGLVLLIPELAEDWL